MNSFLLIIAIISILSSCYAFRPTAALAKTGSSIKPSTSLFAAGKRPNPNNYWEGEWVCADCGYIYDIDFDGGGLYFEEQKKGFICPQCSAPRKRYAKKVGDQWGITRDGGDFPIYFLTFAGLAITAYFSLVVVPTL